MEKYDKQKLIAMQNRSREVHAAYVEISGNRLHYMREAEKLKKIVVEADKKADRKIHAQNNRVKIGKWEGQGQNLPVKITSFTPLHEMPLGEVLDNLKGHPTEPYINSVSLREYIRMSQEFNRLEDHFNDLSLRTKEAIRVVSECMDFLKSKGFSDINIPMK